MNYTVTDTYKFDSVSDKQRFLDIAKTVRCTVCKNQNLYDSLVPQAVDLKNIIATKIKAGDQDDAIYNFLTTRYGEVILYKPSFTSQNFVLWASPFILLVLFLVLIYTNFFKQK
jgi:formate-dependent nitrite reductase complex subunit NrfF